MTWNLLYLSLVCGIAGAQYKNRSPFVGGVTGLLLTVVGVLVLACLPKLKPGDKHYHG